MSMPWFRLYAEFATDPKVQMMTEAMQRRLVMLMCLQCGNGIETLHETERETLIAFQLRIDDAELADTKSEFIRRGFIDEGWNLRNWSKRQKPSDSSAARVRKHREAKKRDVTEGCNKVKRYSNALDKNRIEENREEKKKKKRERDAPAVGSRLPPDWTLPADWRSWAISERPDIDPDREAEKFADYWRAAVGANGRKADWLATWRNWIRRADAPRRSGSTASPDYAVGAL